METRTEQIERLAGTILRLKEDENSIAKGRVAAEEELAALIATKDEGTDTAKTGMFKVSVTSKLNRTLDYEAYQAIESGLPEGVRCVDLKPSLNLKKLRALEMVDPALPATFITTKPAKPSVKIEVIDGN